MIKAEEILQRLGQGIILVDHNGKIQRWNSSAEMIFGWSAEYVLGRAMSTLIPELLPEQLNLRKADVGGSAMKNGKRAQNCRIKRSDGKPIWLEVYFDRVQDPDTLGIWLVYSVCDITGKILAERELDKSRALAKAFIDTAVDAMITIDEQGSITMFNPEAERVFGYKNNEIMGSNVSVLMPEPYSSNHNSYIRQYLESGKEKVIGFSHEMVGKRRDGSVFPMELSIGEVDIRGDRIFTGIIRDISERRRLEHEVLQISEEERRRVGLDLHDGLGQMLTGLGLITRNLVRKLQNRGAMEEATELKEVTGMISEADQMAKGLARGLVNFELESNGLAEALQRVCKQSRRLFDITCSFEQEGEKIISNHLVSINLYRIAQEAINNAVKHGKAGHVDIKLINGKDYLNFEVSDNGIGFLNSSNKTDSNGMGVNIMHYRANMMGGTLEIGETENGWTKVSCAIPKSSLKFTEKVATYGK